jgi:hypothetical protein
LTCDDKYFVSGTTSQASQMRCLLQSWKITELDVPVPGAEVECIPHCAFPCLNGGNCTAPDTCSCALGFTGKSCETQICSVEGDGYVVRK